jgi:Ca2+-binding EF-hand superfamily protein
MRHLCSVLALGLLVAAVPAAPRNKTSDPPGTTAIMARYRLWFATTDANSDGYLDKEELAKVFRGLNARPYDYVPPPKEKKEEEKKADKPDSEGLIEKDKKSETVKPDAKKDYSRYPDYRFLIQLDTDHDGQISRDEFETWAREAAVQLKAQIDLQEKLLKLQMQLVQAQLADRKRIEDQMRRLNGQLKASQSKHIQLNLTLPRTK